MIINALTPVKMMREPADDGRNLPPDAIEQLEAPEQFTFGPVRAYDWNPRTSSPYAEEDRRQIRELHEQADSDIDAHKVEDFSRIYHEGGLLITPGQPVAAGPEAIRRLMGRALTFFSGHQIRYHGTVVSRARDFAFTFGEVAMMSATSGFSANFVIVYRKSDAEAWRLCFDISCPAVVWPGLLHD